MPDPKRLGLSTSNQAPTNPTTNGDARIRLIRSTSSWPTQWIGTSQPTGQLMLIPRPSQLTPAFNGAWHASLPRMDSPPQDG
ncbi:uncharacterized protein N7473_010025 [Penicillium subrubescens]|uniref:uncharacterized protein n=1 Tax=Penicillium subrubescens TaxID=1316194 RepID=UPI002545A521|nr:uncharacterized protein N7473_010025 [Penicillium subrubescens]KAJ5883139.1 hypothetical protein N7473_010025 [Penicillium subrubescens]